MKKRLTRLAAALTLTTLAGLGTLALDDTLTTQRQDTGWGAPDTTDTPIAVDADTSTGINVTLGDSGWG
ncbi:MAG: hypothetical protein HOY75_08160 [Streptomyces sp.]|nr:hypothetical protein [Streptomyces sp.]